MKRMILAGACLIGLLAGCESGRERDSGTRTPVDSVAAAGAADSAGTGTTGIGTTGATANGSGGTRAAGAAADSQNAPR